MNNKPNLLVCDLDNTLYDWVSYFVPSFYAMIDRLIDITEWDREEVLSQFQRVHQKHHDAEHPFSLLEIDLVKEEFPTKGGAKQAKEQFDEAFYAFNSSRKRILACYPGVVRGLEILRENDITLVAHTESKLHAVIDRLRRLDLVRFFERIYCRERGESTHPDDAKAKNWFANFPMERVTELSKHQRKPDVSVLLEICSDLGVPLSETWYVGDSIARDISMAKQAGVTAVWARYGATHDPELYEKLVRITHWTEADVSREARLKEAAKHVAPDYVLEHSFDEILSVMGDANLPKQQAVNI